MRLLFLGFSLLFCLSVSADEKYTLADLEALEKQQQWAELVPHLGDIKPSKRQQAWQRLVQSSMSGRFQQLLKEGNTGNVFAFLDKNLPLYPKMLKDKDFMKKRADFGSEYYSSCLRYNDKECHKEYLGFVSLDPNKAFAFKTAISVRRRSSDRAALGYFHLARPIKEFGQCDDPDLAMAVYAGLTLKNQSEKKDMAQNIAFGSCHETLKMTIKKAILLDEDGLVNNCQLAIKNNSVSGVAMSKCKRYLGGK